MEKYLLLISGGEYGDMYNAELAATIKNIMPTITVKCLGGTNSSEAGKEGSEIDSLNKLLDNEKVVCLILSGQPLSTNLLPFKKAHNKGIPVIYYAGTQTESLTIKKIKKLTGRIDKVLAVFPLEVPMCKEAGMDVEFVGHPLIDTIDSTISRKEARDTLGYDRTEELITLLPGGKQEEAQYMLRLMVEGTAEAAEVSRFKVRLLIPDAEKFKENLLTDLINISPYRIKTFQGQRHTALIASDLAVAVAGPATIEASITGTKMLILQKTSRLSSLLSIFSNGKNKLFGLPNIILDQPLFPELTQRELTKSNITNEMGVLIEEAPTEAIKLCLTTIREKLGPPGTIKRAAESISRTISANSGGG